MREGIHAKEITWHTLLSERPYAGLIFRAGTEALAAGRASALASLSAQKPNVVLSLGDYCLEFLCGSRGIDKWQCSVLSSAVLNGTKVIPAFSTERITKDLSLQLWLSICARKVRHESRSPALVRKPRTYLLNPPLEETLAYLRGPVRDAPQVSVDIETGRGQINTVGFAISPHEAIAVNVLPDRMGADSHRALWEAIAGVLESDQPKILQNFIYEFLYFSRYGIRIRGQIDDTMIRQKLLYPEFAMGLDAVGRMYSELPYWKEDGKSWNNIRDWDRHYEYNCKDTTGTFEGFLGQQRDLNERGLDGLYEHYVRRLFPAVGEMCSWGLPVCPGRLSDMRTQVGGEYDGILAELRKLPGADSLNPRSPTQVKGFLTAAPRKYAIPKKYDSKEKKHKESTDEKSLKKLRTKYPDDPALSLLLRCAKLGKAQSAYLSFGYSEDNRMRYMINTHGTETGRFSGSKDPWGNGVNPQTVPGGSKGINIKSVFEAEAGHTLLQCDLRQAESRFVAYDSADLNLITMLEDTTKDIHRYVAAEIFGVPESEVTKQQRQLGKKSGHGANYSMKEATFIDSCISEMDLVLTRAEATKVLESYHKLFPGIRRWHSELRRELAQTRILRTPLGRERQFWGRLDDDTFREAYAYRPQSTIPDITNHLMLHLLESRKQRAFDFRLLLQCHDSVLLEVPDCFVPVIAKECIATEHWAPVINLAGGRLIIPTEVEVGRNWGNLSKWGKAPNEKAT
jgi:DNA polymerase-1